MNKCHIEFLFHHIFSTNHIVSSKAMAVETLAKIPGRQMLEVRRLEENARFFASRHSEVVTNV